MALSAPRTLARPDEGGPRPRVPSPTDDRLQTETDLIRGCKRRHAPSQEALYRRFWSYAMSVALRYGPTRDDALEVCHDAFLKAFEAIDAVDDGRPFRPWFRQILVRCAIDRHRSTRRHYATIWAEAEPPEPGVLPDQVGALEAADILALLSGLSELHRDVFNLYEIEGHSHDEIAALLGVAPGTSRSALVRAKRQLRALYHQTTALP